MSKPTITNIRLRESHKRQDLVYVEYSHGITTIMSEEDDNVVEWVAEGNTIQEAD